MKNILFLILLISFAFPQVKSVQEIINDVLDAHTNSLRMITHSEDEIINGNHYYFDTFVTLGSGDSLMVSLTIPDTTDEVHMLWSIGSTVAMETWLYEGADVDSISGGSLVLDFNNDRNSTDTSMVSIMSGVAVQGGWDNMGTLIGKSAWGTNKVGGGADRNDMIILKNNTTYIRIIKSGGASNVISLNPKWHEHTPE